MDGPGKLPFDDLIRTSEETVALMWTAYEAHLKANHSAPGWQIKAQELYERCTMFEERLKTLKNVRGRAQRANETP